MHCHELSDGSRYTNLNYLYLAMRKMSLYELRLFEDYFALSHEDSASKARILAKTIFQYFDLLTPKELQKKLEHLFTVKEISTHTGKMIVALHETFTFKVNLRKKEHEHCRRLVQVEMQKKLLEITVLAERGIVERIPETLARLEKKARELELLPELLQVLEMRLLRDSTVKKGAANTAIIEQLAHIEHQSNLIRETNRALWQCISGGHNRLLHCHEEAIRKLARRLNNVSEKVAPISLHFYQEIILALLDLLTGNCTHVVRRMEYLLHQVRENRQIFSKFSYHLPQFLMARADIRSGNFASGLNHAQVILQQLPINHPLGKSVRELAFLAAFYDAQYEQAREILLPMLSKHKKDLEVAEIHPEEVRIAFYWACLLFQSAQFSKCSQVLGQFGNLKYKKYSWSLGYRLLRFMVAVELNQTDLADREYVNFCRHYATFDRGENTDPRWTWIYKTLRDLSACGYHFNQGWKNSPPVYGPGAETKDTIHPPFKNWQTEGQELISFSGWLSGKMKQSSNSNLFQNLVRK